MDGKGKANSAEEIIRDIEERERCAVLAGDAAGIEAFWDPDLLVNGPHGSLLIGRDSTLDMVKSGIINFRRFDREVECIQIENGIAVTMGSETIEQKHGPQAGDVINRRFTNVWLLRDGRWRLRFRHANVSPDRPQ